jgi:hypothetical protein
MPIKERRSLSRILIGEKVKFGTDEPIHEGITHDYSANGISIISDNILPPNSKIVIKIDTKIGRIINVEGEVIWTKTHTNRGSIMGIKFNKPNAELLRIYQISESSSK